MGYKNAYPRGTNFCEVQKVEMGYCTSKWGTDGNPGYNITKTLDDKLRNELDSVLKQFSR
jgi:hypothetical protein